jgi:hypothetical protein
MDTVNTSAPHQATPFLDETSTPGATAATEDDALEREETAEQGIEEAVFYDVPRPFLTLKQAGQILGKSVRALERSISGRWGNKLPDGWQARRLSTSRGDEWRVIPPPGFRMRPVAAAGTISDTMSASEKIESERSHLSYTSSFETTFRRKMPWRAAQHNFEQPTIVIDRSDEVEHLLRELCATQKSLSEERRLHLEDMRLIAQLQGSMRLLETNTQESRRVKDELALARQELEQLKQNYKQLLSMSWWQRVFGFNR